MMAHMRPHNIVWWTIILCGWTVVLAAAAVSIHTGWHHPWHHVGGQP